MESLRRLSLALLLLVACAAFSPQLGSAAPDGADDSLPYWAYGRLVFDAGDSCWYSADESGAPADKEPLFKQIDGKAYPYRAWAEKRQVDDVLMTRLYPNGELVFQMGDWERPDRLESGCHCVRSDFGVTWFRESEQAFEFVASHVTAASFDASLLRDDVSDYAGENLSAWLANLDRLESVDGIANLQHMRIDSAAGMFTGCSSLRSLDLSGPDWSSCRDLAGMLDGCTALSTLVLSESWGQQAANASGQAARFPVEMAYSSAGKHVVYAAGSIIPDYAGTYVTTRTDIAPASLTLLEPGRFVASGEQLAAGGWEGLGLPDGISYEDVVIFTGTADIKPLERNSFEYTGEAIEPTPVVELNGALLRAGTDYTIVFEDNVEDGTALVTLSGIGAYRGEIEAEFHIVDNGAYAFLYDDGTLVLQAGHEALAGMSASPNTPERLFWFNDASGAGDKLGTPWESRRAEITGVCIDASFKRFSLTSCAEWFSGCTSLTKISGLANLDGSALVFADRMLAGCASLETLDLSGLYSAHIESMTGMLDGCTALTTLVADASWQNAHDVQKRACFPIEAFCTSDGYQRHPAGSPIPHGAGSYRTNGLPLQLATVTLDKPSFECTGTPVEPRIEVRVGKTLLTAGNDYTIAYENNLLPGAAKLTITGTGAFTGGLVVPFRIQSTVSAVGDRLVYRTPEADYTLEVIAVQSTPFGTKPAGFRILAINVRKPGLGTLSLPSQCTVGGVNVDVTAVAGKLTGTFHNVSCVVIGAKVVVIGKKAFANAPKVKRLQLLTQRLRKATGSLKGSHVKKVTAKCKLSRSKRKAYKRMFEKQAGRKGVRFAGGK